jgi:DsbC/DsbD-like thiol-disulfide interchange protein
MRAILSIMLSLVVLALPVVSRAEIASPWDGPEHGKARLVLGQADTDGRTRIMAGIEIVLSPGWKTYWRNPGESGVPPYFDWTGSSNTTGHTVLYPAPKRMHDAGMDSIGYTDRVVFPVQFDVPDAGKPARFVLTFEYGVCKEICMPAVAKLSIELPAGRNVPASPVITEFLDRVPAKGKPGDPEISALQLTSAKSGRKLVIEASFPNGAANADIFMEGADGTFVPMTTAVVRDGTTARFEALFSNADDIAALKGKALKFTLVSEKGQCWSIRPFPES